MSDFRKYTHIERLGTDEVEHILDGTCHVFPKIDGTNASVWLGNDGLIKAGSRTREITLNADNAGFCKWVTENTAEFANFFQAHPNFTIHGEWLVPHTLRTYREEVWRNFYIFDVYSHDLESYLHYDDYSAMCSMYLPFPVIAPLEIVSNPTLEHLTGLLDRNTYLIADGNGSGEGIVIKRYGFVNSWGRPVFAKVVRNEFKERNLIAFGTPTVEMRESLESKIAIEYVTRGRILKTLEKMRDTAPLTSKRIPELLGRVWIEIVRDETYDIIKRNKFPTINFKSFHRHVITQIKANCPELFGV